MTSLPTNPDDVAELGNLDFIARQLVEGMMMGRHRSPYKGSSVEFVEHRQYHPGDEIRHIDWRAFGKTGRYYVKEYEDETNLRAYILLDASGSMKYAGASLAKFDYARIIAATLSWLLLSQRDSVGLMTFDSQIRQQLKPSASRSAFQEILRVLDATAPAAETSLAETLTSILPGIKQRSLLVLISDCLDSIDLLEAALQQCRHARHEIVIFRVAAPEEVEFPFRSPTQFRDFERAGHQQLVDPARLRNEYLQQYAEFTKRLDRICGNLAIDYVSLQTSDSLQEGLGNWLDRRMRLSGR